MSTLVDQNIKLGERIRKKRKAINLTQRDLANHLGISVQQMQKYEAGKNRISAVNLLAIEDLIGPVRADYVIAKKHVANNLMGSNSSAQKLVSIIGQLNINQQKALYKFVSEMLKAD
jgi:transcriptional regulator with XRE-family HTH domain